MVAGVFFSYRTISSLFTQQEEETRVCINLSCIVHDSPSLPKIAPKVESIKQPSKKRIEKVVKKQLKKKLKTKKEVIVKETPPEVMEIEVQEAVEVVVEEKKPESHVLVTPEGSEVVIEDDSPQTPVHTPQEEYVEENLAKIIELLQENLYYPRRARKRGIEGEVVVSFKLSVNAQVSDVKVLSSQSDILSRGAIKTIEDLSFKFPKPKEDLDLSVPIYYKLQ